MDTEQIKQILGITTDKHDAYLDTVIPLFLEFAEDYCNNTFEVIPGPVKIFVAKAAQHNMQVAGLKSRTMGEVSYSYDTEFPSSILKYLSRYRKVRFV